MPFVAVPEILELFHAYLDISGIADLRNFKVNKIDSENYVTGVEKYTDFPVNENAVRDEFGVPRRPWYFPPKKKKKK